MKNSNTDINVLNLYAGIGGNRTHWSNCRVTAIENNESIARFYQKRFPNDQVLICDAHQYLLDHYDQFDFIWSSYPCQQNSRARFWNRKLAPVYPGLGLYQEIIFLREFFRGDWIVENVIPYYETLIDPTIKIGRHLFWSNRKLNSKFRPVDLKIVEGTRDEYESALGIKLLDHTFNQRTDQILRNCVHPDVGKQLFDHIRGIEIESQDYLFN